MDNLNSIKLDGKKIVFEFDCWTDAYEGYQKIIKKQINGEMKNE